MRRVMKATKKNMQWRLKKENSKESTAKESKSKAHLLEKTGGKVRILGSIAHLLCHNNYPFIILTKTITSEIYHK
jgi:hypothetical protein